jgi:hypothetical protein
LAIDDNRLQVANLRATISAGHWTQTLSFQLLLTTALVMVAALSFLKGYRHQLWDWGEPYFFLSYRDGLLKRGLVGQIFNGLDAGASPEEVRTIALWSYDFVCVALVACLTAWTWTVGRSLLGIFALFATSQFLPTLGFDTGYLDPYVYILFVMAAIAFARRNYAVTAALGFVGPFVHESFIFVWLSLVFLAYWEGLDRIRVATILVPFASTAAIFFLHSPSAATAQINAAPLSDLVKDGMLRYQFGLTLSTALKVMWQAKFSQHYLNYVIAIVFFSLPAGLMLWNSARGRDLLYLSLAAFAPLLNTLVAWDLSRFAVLTNLTALVAILYFLTVRNPKGLRLTSGAVCWVVAGAMFSLPLIYAFFEVASIKDGGLIPFARTPLAAFVQNDLLAAYSRNAR